MIKYEIIKIVKNSFFWIMYIIMFVANFFFMYNREYSIILEKKQDCWERNKEDYSYVKGKITNETITYAKNIGAQDLLIYGGSEHYRNIQSAIYYQELCGEIVNKAKDNILVYSRISNDKLVYKNTKVIECFESREIREYYTYRGIHEYLSYDYSTLFTIIISITIIFILFFYDNKCGMNKIVLTTVNGVNRIFCNKSVVLIMICVILQLIFRVQEFIVYAFLYSFEGLHMPLYSLKEYSHTFLDVTIKEFILYDAMFKCLGFTIFGLSMIIIVKLTKRQGLSLLIFLFMYIITVTQSLSKSILYTPIQMFDIYTLARSEKLIFIGEQCVTHTEFSVCISLIIILLQVVTICVIKDK